MSPLRLVSLAMRSILRNAGRSFLTVLGVVIGVGSVVVMVAIGQGAQAQIEARINSLGTNLVVITPGATTTGGVSGGAGSMDSLKIEDAVSLGREAQLLAAVSPVIFTRTSIVGRSGNWRTTIYGVDLGYQRIRAWPVAEGRFFEEDDVEARRKVCVLGATVAAALYDEGEAVGQLIRLRDVPFRVIGVLEPKGQTAEGADQDDVILAPYTTIRYRLAGRQFLAQILASAYSEEDLEPALAEVRQILRENHRLSPRDPDDFTARDQRQLAETARETTDVMTTLLLVVASVSLLVGGIGIMNIMLVSVTERTREIGIRRALGARRADVLAQFLVESVVLSGLGGLIGAMLGVGASALVGRLTGWATEVTPATLGLAMAFSFAVGVFFGWVPARRAAALDPIEALRHT